MFVIRYVVSALFTAVSKHSTVKSDCVQNSFPSNSGHDKVKLMFLSTPDDPENVFSTKYFFVS